ncbi:Nicotianamine synthase [Eremomyces bilateralis CBS 781.70]|uniref:Nicotianamine synthase n=1 Tax=Eremomyces bilateralis CBS 781.70 TaxID=1392243 RepID=A0A6G1G3J2_9PEZI|nr:Nicotianamine synthase [Eremomyces bilateralis CBS 781.70]KAF1812480.1 Nicotianamine synthase [Eremomyces bilateralis CBS 781.70]
MTTPTDRTATVPVQFQKPYRGSVAETSGLVTPPDDTGSPPTLHDDSAREEAHDIIERLVGIYHQLLAHRSLAPSAEVSETFGRLVRACIEPRSKQTVELVLSDPVLNKIASSLLKLCSAGETELELSWAGRICHLLTDSSAAQETLRAFPYYDNYARLSRLECANLVTLLPSDPTSIAFIGCGPLPLSSFCLSDRFPAARINNIDHDVTAISHAEKLSNALGYDQVTFTHASAAECGSLRTFDVVLMAALVGMDQGEKMNLVRNLAAEMRPGAILCIRSAHSLRSLLYPTIEMSIHCLDIGLRPLLEVHPWHDVVNSTLFTSVERTDAGDDR